MQEKQRSLKQTKHLIREVRSKLIFFQAENQALEMEFKLEENDANFFNMLNSRLPSARLLEPHPARPRPSMTAAKSVRDLHTPLLGSNKISPARSVRKLVPLKDSQKPKNARFS